MIVKGLVFALITGKKSSWLLYLSAKADGRGISATTTRRCFTQQRTFPSVCERASLLLPSEAREQVSGTTAIAFSWAKVHNETTEESLGSYRNPMS